jgi:hypothetical protein
MWINKKPGILPGFLFVAFIDFAELMNLNRLLKPLRLILNLIRPELVLLHLLE